MKTNINVACKVELTLLGANIWNNRYGDSLPMSMQPDPVPKGTVIETQLWTLMSVFGPHIEFGMGYVPFKDNNIEIMNDL